jgi:hypothetical protein
MTAEEYDQLCRAECFVCAIVAGRSQLGEPQIIYEDDSMLAFLNHFPTQEGYTLVCPKRHAERFEGDLSAEDWCICKEWFSEWRMPWPRRPEPSGYT